MKLSKTNLHINMHTSHAAQRPRQRRYSLFVEAAAAAGGGAILAQRLGELMVQVVGHGAWDPLPGQDEDDHHGVLAAVPRTMAHQTQQLLLLAAPPDHLR